MSVCYFGKSRFTRERKGLTEGIGQENNRKERICNRERLYSIKRIDKNNGLKNNREERRNKMNMTEEQQKRENNQEEWIEEQLGRKDQQEKVEKN